ncbi:MAG: glycosyltransferase family 2 protein, partial [Bacilli bacterium]|nr:glycosyltransferase family 2 protein [Bacilli bacterium]
MKEDLVSVIIPTYKRSDKVEKAIKSVLEQTYPNIEIIVVDDNKKFPKEREKTKEIIKKYPNIKYLENDSNLGGALSRNKGILQSKGKYIAFLDDDDMFYPTKIEKQMKLMHQLEKEGIHIGMIYCYKTTFDQNNHHKKSPKINVEGNCLLEHMLNQMETTSTWLCPKEVLLKVGMFENVHAHQDNILLLKILGEGYCIN